MTDVIFKFDVDETVYLALEGKEDCSVDTFQDYVVTALKRQHFINYYYVGEQWIEESRLLSASEYAEELNRQIDVATSCILNKIEHIENL